MSSIAKLFGEKILNLNKGAKAMYVNPFWMGVLTTVVVELVAMIVYAAVKGEKK